ncbi:Hsp20/alpha crystallin family protein [Cellulosimicrobium cellulans]|jgi:HSP20 family protein|nr:Hsp20/alpha crystallin family protein [Sphaerisporangium cinnabarinum]MCR1984540.1 Hsp20/alpha crystallin family protein [Cellulosimicrobium cellulans]UTT60582.1 Hsp20/alpha crystallin family protein [Cellulosimicrobium cellulans]
MTDPFTSTFDAMDRLVGQLASGARATAASAASGGMPLDLFRAGDHYVLTMDLPGVDPGTIDVSVEDRTLTIRAERSPRTDPDVQWLARERPSGTYARQLTVGRGLALDKITASYEDGVLTLTIPVAEEARPRRIEVAHRAGGAATQITAEAEPQASEG